MHGVTQTARLRTVVMHTVPAGRTQAPVLESRLHASMHDGSQDTTHCKLLRQATTVQEREAVQQSAYRMHMNNVLQQGLGLSAALT